MKLNYDSIKDIDLYDRISHLKGVMSDETAYIVTCGPSLTSHDQKTLLKKLDGKFVIACKQAYEYVRSVTNVHCLSVYNYQPYTYDNSNIIRHWQFTAVNLENEINRVRDWQHRVDIVLPVYSHPWVMKEQTTAFAENFDNWKLYAEGQAVWGPGIMLESAIPLAVHLGCKRIVTIGWDIGDLSRFNGKGNTSYDSDWYNQHATDLYNTETGTGPDYEELKNTIECTSAMYDWFLENKIKVNILSETNPADRRFERIKLEQL